MGGQAVISVRGSPSWGETEVVYHSAIPIVPTRGVEILTRPPGSSSNSLHVDQRKPRQISLWMTQ